MAPPRDAVDPSTVEIGSSKKNVVFDERAHKNVRSYSTAGIIQNTWREIRPTS